MEVLIKAGREGEPMDPQRLILRLKRETDPCHLLSHGFHQAT